MSPFAPSSRHTVASARAEEARREALAEADRRKMDFMARKAQRQGDDPAVPAAPARAVRPERWM